MHCGLAALALSVSFAAAAGPIAFVADIRGNATIEGDGKLTFLAELSAGTRVLLGSNASASIAYAATGAEFALAGPGQFLVSADEVTAEKGATPKRRTMIAIVGPGVVGRAAHTATASLRMRGVAPPGTSAPGLEFPVSTRIATLRPTMRWRGVPNQEYTLILLDASGRELWKGRGKPEGTRPVATLAPGSRYSWSVVAPGGALHEAQFETLPMAAIGRVEKSRSGSRTFPERVLHALLLEEVGAQQEAREAWGELARERPDLPELKALAR
jgi:ELWxxDGT repeat protein